MKRLVLLRHGESVWNRENRFTGWADVDLSEHGREEARRAGEILRAEGFDFDLAFCSVLRRAIKTLWLALEEMDRMWIPVQHSWRLNERHYGALQGLNKAETAAKFGEVQVKIWRRSYDTPPPALEDGDARLIVDDPRYRELKPADLPRAECLKDTVARVVPFWNTTIVPAIRGGKQVIVAAHGNSLRALMKHIENISDRDIVELNVPTAIPLVYELDDALRPVGRRYLGDQSMVTAAMTAVANQGKAGA